MAEGKFSIREFGAIPDGVTNNAQAIQRAIDEASRSGGQVVIPAGHFLSGTLILKSHIDLHLEKGAVLIGSLRPEDILDFARLFDDDNACTGWDGGCFLFACHERDITISGEGEIWGQGEKVFFDDDADSGAHECPLRAAAFRPRTTFLEDVEDLTIRDVTIRNAAFWTLHMAGCRHVRIKDIRILNHIRGANNDGIDPDCCRDVIITGCLIQTGDDAIVVKSTKPMAARYGGSENIVISHCILYSRDSGLKIGSETHGDIRNLLMSDCVIRDCSRGVGIWARDGAVIEDVHVHHLTGSVRRYADGVRADGPAVWWGKGEPIFIDAAYRNSAHRYPGKIQNITFDQIFMKAESSIFIAGEQAARVSGVTLADLQITMCPQGTQPCGYFDEQPSERDVYPHAIPALYARCADGLTVRGRVRFTNPYSMEKNGLFMLEDCAGARIELTEEKEVF